MIVTHKKSGKQGQLIETRGNQIRVRYSRSAIWGYAENYLFPEDTHSDPPVSPVSDSVLSGTPSWDITDSDRALVARVASQIAEILKPDDVTLEIALMAIELTRTGLCRYQESLQQKESHTGSGQSL